MRLLVAPGLGDLDQFRLADVDVPEPQPGQVRIQVEAAAAGYVDGLIAQGRYQLKPSLPHTPGGEIAGLIDMIGLDVQGLEVGDRVVTWQLSGGFADYTIALASQVDRLPDGLSAVTAASALVDYQTARYALNRAMLREGETVLVLGGAGGVGLATVQFASRAGARVIAASSTADRRDLTLTFGASDTVDSGSTNLRDELRTKGLDGAIDVIVDPVGGEQFESLFRSLAKEGRHLIVGFAGGRIPSLPANLALLKSASLVGVDIRHHLATAPVAAKAARDEIFGLLANGGLKPPPVDLYPLDRAGEALAATLARRKAGKIVVQPGQSGPGGR